MGFIIKTERYNQAAYPHQEGHPVMKPIDVVIALILTGLPTGYLLFAMLMSS